MLTIKRLITLVIVGFGFASAVWAENFNVKLDFGHVPNNELSKVGKIYIVAWSKKNFLDKNIFMKEGKVVTSLAPSAVIHTTLSITEQEVNFNDEIAFTAFVDHNGNEEFDQKEEIFGCTTTNANLRNQVNVWNFLFNKGKIFKDCRVKLKDIQSSNATLSFLLTTLN
jgi:hypothetical protein